MLITEATTGLLIDKSVKNIFLIFWFNNFYFRLISYFETPSLITRSPSETPETIETLPKFLLPISTFFFSAMIVITHKQMLYSLE